MAKMTIEEKKNFDKLYQYIKNEIFEYDTQSLPKYMVLRLMGLKEGKFMANNKVKSMANYNYQYILYTFKINKMNIKNVVKSDKYKNEQHRFNTIMIIIEREINDVVNRLKQVIKNEEKLESMDLKNTVNEGAEYKSKNKKKSDKLKDLW